MPGKSRRGKGKYSEQSKKGKSRTARRAPVARPPVMPRAGESISPPRAAASPVSVPARTTEPAAVAHPYIAGELRNIAIVAVIMLVVLVVLALLLA